MAVVILGPDAALLRLGASLVGEALVVPIGSAQAMAEGTDHLSAEIVDSKSTGGANTSHTIVVPALARLLAVVPANAEHAEYEQAALGDNVLDKDTDGARRRTFRYLRELYLLRPDSVLFRALRDLWPDDPTGQPLLAGLCALARDPVFRASRSAISGSETGSVLRSDDLASAVDEVFPGHYNEGTLAKIGRNTFSSWEQTGHLVPGGRSEKLRARAVCRPSNVAYALFLGYLEGGRGEALFTTPWVEILDVPQSHMFDLAAVASQRGIMEFRRSGNVIDVGFRELLRPFEGQLA